MRKAELPAVLAISISRLRPQWLPLFLLLLLFLPLFLLLSLPASWNRLPVALPVGQRVQDFGNEQAHTRTDVADLRSSVGLYYLCDSCQVFSTACTLFLLLLHVLPEGAGDDFVIAQLGFHNLLESCSCGLPACKELVGFMLGLFVTPVFLFRLCWSILVTAMLVSFGSRALRVPCWIFLSRLVMRVVMMGMGVGVLYPMHVILE